MTSLLMFVFVIGIRPVHPDASQSSAETLRGWRMIMAWFVILVTRVSVALLRLSLRSMQTYPPASC